jgi:hypothetical protein
MISYLVFVLKYRMHYTIKIELIVKFITFVHILPTGIIHPMSLPPQPSHRLIQRHYSSLLGLMVSSISYKSNLF